MHVRLILGLAQTHPKYTASLYSVQKSHSMHDGMRIGPLCQRKITTRGKSLVRKMRPLQRRQSHPGKEREKRNGEQNAQCCVLIGMCELYLQWVDLVS